jgi:hypothetical protein
MTPDALPFVETRAPRAECGLQDYLRGCLQAPVPLTCQRRSEAAFYGGIAITCAIVTDDEECAGLAARCAWRQASRVPVGW